MLIPRSISIGLTLEVVRADSAGAMLWFFEKQQSRLHYEIRRQSDGHNYELIITYSDGRTEVEVYEDPGAVVERSERLKHSLTQEGWQSPGRRARHLIAYRDPSRAS